MGVIRVTKVTPLNYSDELAYCCDDLFVLHDPSPDVSPIAPDLARMYQGETRQSVRDVAANGLGQFEARFTAPEVLSSGLGQDEA